MQPATPTRKWGAPVPQTPRRDTKAPQPTPSGSATEKNKNTLHHTAPHRTTRCQRRCYQMAMAGMSCRQENTKRVGCVSLRALCLFLCVHPSARRTVCQRRCYQMAMAGMSCIRVMQNRGAVCLKARCPFCVVHLWRGGMTAPTYSGLSLGPPWGRPAALPTGAVELLATPRPLCLRALSGL